MKLVSLLTVLSVLSSPLAAESITPLSSSIIASGLNGPRGMTFGSNGQLYIAESGIGGNTTQCVPSPSAAGQNLCYGPSGSIVALDVNNGNLQRVVTSIPSLALADGSDATGINDLVFDSTGKLWGVIGFAGDANLRDTQVGVADFGNLVSIDLLNGTWNKEADLAAFEIANNFDGTDVVSNPYSLVISNGEIYIVDAGANALLKQTSNGLQLQTTFPLRQVTNPFNPSTTIPMQPVPTGIAAATDQGIYVGQYTGFPFPPGAANVYEYSPNNLQVSLDGFTNITDISFDSQGNLYVLEYATDLLQGNLQSNLWKVATNGDRSLLWQSGLSFATGVTVGSDGSIYIANQAYTAGTGQIVKLSAVPEPSQFLGLLTASGLLTLCWQKRKSFKSK